MTTVSVQQPTLFPVTRNKTRSGRRRGWSLKVRAEVVAAQLGGFFGKEYGGEECFACKNPMLMTRECRYPCDRSRMLIWRCPTCYRSIQQWRDGKNAGLKQGHGWCFRCDGTGIRDIGLAQGCECPDCRGTGQIKLTKTQ